MHTTTREIFIENGSPFATKLIETTETWCPEEILVLAGVDPDGIKMHTMSENHEDWFVTPGMYFERRVLRNEAGQKVEVEWEYKDVVKTVRERVCQKIKVIEEPIAT